MDNEPIQVNNGFWDLPPDERAARMEAACERNGVENFFDLPPEERGRAYERNDGY
jgi:hypothetical protein